MKKRCAVVSVALAAALLGTSVSAYAEAEENKSLIQLFETPDTNSKPMARFWLPDAAETYEQFERELTELYEAGFGGVEIAFFPAITSFDNTKDGWATENWRNCMKNILKVAASFETPFRVDFTITPGWPVALNTVDPNKENADTELTYAVKKITDISGVTDVPMAEIVKEDFVKNPFIFKNSLVKAVIAQVTDVKADGTLILAPSTIKTLETTVSEKVTPAGIPDVSNLAEDSAEYEYVRNLYEGEIPDTSVYFKDSVGNNTDVRTALEDTQEYYQTDLSSIGLDGYTPSEGDTISAGDYVLYGFYIKGNGETTQKMGLWAPYADATPGVAYDTSPFSSMSAESIISYLDENVFCDEELITLMHEAAERSGGAIFEDSLENTYQPEIPWTYDYLTYFSEDLGYELDTYLPFLIGAEAAEESTEKYITDYEHVLNKMYMNNHISKIQSYINEKTGFAYRAQAYLTPRNEVVLDTSAASSIVDLAEGESLAFGSNYDNFRYISGGVHIAGKKQISSESFAIQDGSSYNLTWDRVVKIMNGDFAAGVNKIIFHGTSADVSMANSGETEYSNAWPGWSAFISICTDDWDGRMPYWDDMNILTEYISRNQAILNNGTSKVDLLIYDENAYDPWNRAEGGDGSAFNSLLDAGYTYDNVMSEGLLMEQLKAEEGLLCAEGPAYKALIVNEMDSSNVEILEKLLNVAENGVPVIFYQSAPEKSSTAVNSKDEVSALMEKIKSTENAVFTDSQAEIQQILVKREILPEASYIKGNLRCQTKEDTDGTRYYYFYNNSDEIIETDVTLKGNGNLYWLNAWDGSVTSGNAASENDCIHTKLQLNPYDTVIAMITENIGDTEVKDCKNIVSTQNKIPLESWNLEIESWGPEKETVEEYDTKKTAIDLGQIELGTWGNLTADEDALKETGVETLADVSGIGTYTTTVDITGATGGYLTLEHGSDMITGIIVNGQNIENLNPLSNVYDIGNTLVEGSNTIEVKLATTLINRTRVENALFENCAQREYGITSANLLPYNS